MQSYHQKLIQHTTPEEFLQFHEKMKIIYCPDLYLRHLSIILIKEKQYTFLLLLFQQQEEVYIATKISP